MRITVYERMGYIEYYDTKEFARKASQMDASVTVGANDTNKAIYEKIHQTNWSWLDPWENLLKVVNSTLRVKS